MKTMENSMQWSIHEILSSFALKIRENFVCILYIWLIWNDKGQVLPLYGGFPLFINWKKSTP